MPVYIPPRIKKPVRLPIVFSVTTEEANRISSIARESLKAIREGRGNINNALDVMFRVKIGAVLAEEIYDKETLEQYLPTVDSVLLVLIHWVKHRDIVATEQQLLDMEDALDAVDQMHTENTRRILLDAYKKSREYIYKLVRDYVPPDIKVSNYRK